jgi:hypothetical protein
MTEIKINIELGMNAALQQFVAAVFGQVNHAVINQPEVHTATIEQPKPTRRARAAKAADVVEEAAPVKPAPVEAADVVEEAAPVKPAPVEAAPVEEEQKDNITLPDLRLALLRLYAGGKNKDITDGIMKQMGARNLTEIAKDKYDELYKVLISKAEEMGL